MAGVVGRRITEGRDPAPKIWPLREAGSSNDSRRTVEEERLRQGVRTDLGPLASLDAEHPAFTLLEVQTSSDTETDFE